MAVATIAAAFTLAATAGDAAAQTCDVRDAGRSIDGCGPLPRSEAGPCYESAAKDTNCPVLLRLACNAYYTDERDEEALRACTAYVDDPPADADPADIEQIRERVAELRRKKAERQLGAAEMLMKDGKPYEAITMYEEARKTADSLAIAWGLCRAYWATGQYDRAAHEFELFARSGREDPSGLGAQIREAAETVEAAVAALNAEQASKAIALLQPLARHGHPPVYFLLCQAYARAGRVAEAREACEFVVKRSAVPAEREQALDELALLEPKAPASLPSVNPESSEDDQDPWHRDKKAWLLVGSGAAAVGVGIGLYAKSTAWESIIGDPAYSPETQNEAADKAGKYRTLGVASGIAGAGLIAFGIYRFATGNDKAPLTERPALPAAPTGIVVGPSWVGYTGTF